MKDLDLVVNFGEHVHQTELNTNETNGFPKIMRPNEIEVSFTLIVIDVRQKIFFNLLKPDVTSSLSLVF